MSAEEEFKTRAPVPRSGATPDRIVLATFGSLGDFHPMMALALSLRARGHWPVLAGPAIHAEKARAEGLEFWPLPPDWPDLERQLGVDRAGVARALEFGPSFFIRKMVLPFLRANFAEMQKIVPGASLVVFNNFSYGARLAAEAAGLPYVAVAVQPASFLSAFDPPAGLRLPLIPNPRFFAPVAFNVIVRAAMLFGARAWGHTIYRMRREEGLPWITSDPLFHNQLEADATLALYSKTLSKVHPDFPKHTTICGFARYDGQSGAAPKISAELTAFLAKGPPPVVFTLGSFAADDPGDFFEASAAAARRLGQRAVLLVGELGDAKVSHDVIACRYVPHSWLFPRAAAIVHHAGIGTIGEALLAGRPQLAVPITLDHPDNAAHMRRLGVGRVLPRQRYTAERATRELKALLGAPKYAAKAAAVSAIVRAEDGAETAADIIEQVLVRNAGEHLSVRESA